MKRFLSPIAILIAFTPVPALADFAVSDWVLAKWGDDGFYYPAVIERIDGASAALRYDDGAQDNQPLAQLKAYDWKPGSKIECQRTDDSWHAASIKATGTDGATLVIRSDDGRDERTMSKHCRSR
jgi:hypothetical protein